MKPSYNCNHNIDFGIVIHLGEAKSRFHPSRIMEWKVFIENLIRKSGYNVRAAVVSTNSDKNSNTSMKHLTLFLNNLFNLHPTFAQLNTLKTSMSSIEKILFDREKLKESVKNKHVIVILPEVEDFQQENVKKFISEPLCKKGVSLSVIDVDTYYRNKDIASFISNNIYNHYQPNGKGNITNEAFINGVSNDICDTGKFLPFYFICTNDNITR